ncbi:uncharacterized protein C8Q71DRAFT_763457 [Rhodofomes roseus]|uniref:DinB-like domain-containing protein n=1 Tax=Rhodofomes roseus TaxID=34475 RepID=A0ABQ8KEF4_9APHY|nr:uncharacterized protein C8Q71DRAFT_763457 [Rhodofomes roseus]KAH9835791.1 hypothetical protein C8Q71DRAFT_763457 [Rhodofomes roseus]
MSPVLTPPRHTDAASSAADEQLDEATALARLLEVSTIVLRQAVDLVDTALTSDDQLTVQSQYLPGSTIGKHLRHARDHFVLLMECLSTPSPHILNYDVRSRNTPMESSRQAARGALDAAIEQLNQTVPRAKMEEPITLRAITPYPQVVQTTFGRELWFAGLHAVHHWSMVRVIAGELGIRLEESFGFAPSTLVHNNSQAPLGKHKM